MSIPKPSRRTRSGQARVRTRLVLELLEARDMPSQMYPDYILHSLGGSSTPQSSSAPTGYTPAEIEQAYGINQIAFKNGTVPGDGRGTTIAIVDAYSDPNIVNDLHQFDSEFGLPDPTFTQVNETGGGTLPSANAGWAGETVLDVEWAHAIAPGASILLVEANDSSNTNLYKAASFAATQPGVVVISMSFAGTEASTELQSDSDFVTPANHAGVTFVAASGDKGAPTSYPATSPNVLAVGGTTLNLDGSGNIISEGGWTGSGGGISAFESQPTYQKGTVTQSSTKRANPDVAYDADPNTGYSVYDSYNFPVSAPWNQTGGTSAAAPQWAALIAIADEGRAQQVLTSLDGPSQTLPALYSLPALDFNDITTGGSTGTPHLAAAPGYDLVTGRGTPVANLLVAGLVGLSVTGSTPTVGSRIAAAPTNYVVHFSLPVNPSTLQASEFTIDGQPASSVTLDPTGLTATFTFTTNPGASQGVHTMHIAAGSNTELGNPTTALVDFTGTFTVSTAAATHFAVTTSTTSTTAGTAISVTVTAQSAAGVKDTMYSGRVHFTTSDTGSAVALPIDYTFTTLDAGAHDFTATLVTAGSQTLTASDTAYPSITGASKSVTVGPAAATQLAVKAPGQVDAGSAFAVTVMAEDSFGNVAPTYGGTVHFMTTDTAAGVVVHADYTFVSSDKGVHIFPSGATLITAGSQTVSVNDTLLGSVTAASGVVNVNPAATTHFTITLPSSTKAGKGFVFVATALDQYGNVATSYSGTVVFTSSDPQANLPDDVTLTAGVGLFAGFLGTAGNQTVTATDFTVNTITGTSAAISVIALAANHLVVVAPASAVTGNVFSVTVTAVDAFNNPAPGYNGTVHLTSSDPGAILSTSNIAVTSGVGTFSATLETPGSQTLTATDTLTASITGTSSLIATRGLIVTSFAPTPTGFVAQFSKAFDPTMLNLYDAQGALGAPDITLTGPSGTAVRGSVLVDPTDTTITFLKTGNALAGVLTAGTYTVDFRSASNGFKDALGGVLDGNNSGIPGSNFVTTFTVASTPTVILSIPDFARGPDDSSDIKLPNNIGTGIPITLTGAAGVTDVTFDLSYNPALLNITDTLNGPAAGSTFSLVSINSGVASFSFQSPTPLNGTLTLGQIVAQVPSSAAATYKAKELLHLGNIVVNTGNITATNKDGVHVVAYFGDTNGDGSLSPVDASLISRVATALDTGFAAFPLLDPIIIGDLTNSGGVVSTDVTLLNSTLAGKLESQIPTPPTGLSFTPAGPDPTLSLPTAIEAAPGSTVVVPVTIDTARPDGSTGMMEAVLALRIDPRVFDVSTAEVQLGTLPAAGNGWQLQVAVNAQTGEIGIDLFSSTPIQTAAGGSLVTLTLQVCATAPTGPTALELAPQVNPTGQHVFQTEVSDATGAFVLHPALTTGGTEPGLPGQVTVAGSAGASPAGSAASGLWTGADRQAASENQVAVEQTTIGTTPTLGSSVLPGTVMEQVFGDLELMAGYFQASASLDSEWSDSAPATADDLAWMSPTMNDVRPGGVQTQSPNSRIALGYSGGFEKLLQNAEDVPESDAAFIVGP